MNSSSEWVRGVLELLALCQVFLVVVTHTHTLSLVFTTCPLRFCSSSSLFPLCTTQHVILMLNPFSLSLHCPFLPSLHQPNIPPTFSV